MNALEGLVSVFMQRRKWEWKISTAFDSLKLSNFSPCRVKISSEDKNTIRKEFDRHQPLVIFQSEVEGKRKLATKKKERREKRKLNRERIAA